MQRVLPHSATQALVDAAGSREAEARAMAALPPHELMRRAGLALAKLAQALSPPGSTIGIACGPGNNGGDGLLAAALLRSAGRSVHVRYLPGANSPPADAAWAHEQAASAGVSLIGDGGHDEDWPAECGLIIDALLGLGLKRAPDARLAHMIASINRHPAPVLAVDVPSGLCSDSGALVGADPSSVIRADHTLTLLSLKPGLFTGHGREYCGEIWFDDLGATTPAQPRAWLSGTALLSPWQQARQHDAHKGTQGDALVIGGAPGMRGAALLAARAALAAGAGRVYACLLGSQSREVDAQRPELMSWGEAQLSSHKEWADKLIIAGCGGGTAIAEHLPALLHHTQALVLDADALNALAMDPGLQARLRQRHAPGLQTIVTPHPLEAARLLGRGSAEVQRERLASAEELAAKLQCTVVLKGSGTIIASPGKCSQINPTGNGALATAGTGDVLAGWLGGLWAQARDRDTPPNTIAATAVYWHGWAAESQLSGPLRAADLVERMHALHHAPR